MMESSKQVFGQENSKIVNIKKKRPDDMNKIVQELVQIVWPNESKGNCSASNRLNRNVVYAQINALLIKEIHLNGLKFSRDIELCRDVQINVNRGEFLFVMRTDGRFVTISEEAEFYLSKSMRSLYAQCINIFDCLDENDAVKLKQIFDSNRKDAAREHQIVCTLRLPKGKRPSRAAEDVTTIIMTGHFYSCHFPTFSDEKLFVARCQPLVVRNNKANSSNIHSSTNFEISLNDDMSISSVSSNVEQLLGYRRTELINQWFGRFLPTEDLGKFEQNRIKTYDNESKNESRTPKIVQDVCDIFTKNGESRLTFRYEIRAKRTRKTRPLKFDINFQMIDPTLRFESSKYLQNENVQRQIGQVEQVNLGANSVCASEKNSFVADCPTFAGPFLDDQRFSPKNQCEPWTEFLSDNFTPYEFDQQLERQLFNRFSCGVEDQQMNVFFDDELGFLALDCIV